MNPRPSLVTIWAHYGPYHLARVSALEALFDVIGYSYAAMVPTYEFFHTQPPRHFLINNETVGDVNPFLSLWRTLTQLWRDQPELVLACGYERPETLAAVIYSRLKKLPVGRRPIAIMMVDNQLRDKSRHRFVEQVKRAYLPLADGFLVGGPTHIDYLVALGIDETKIRTGYNCVDNERIASIASVTRSNWASGFARRFPAHFLTLGRLIPKKNLASVLSAFAKYRERLPTDREPWHLVIAGDGPSAPELRTAVASLGLNSFVHFVGRVDRFEDVVSYYACSRAFILASSHSEQWGLVVNEAMAAALPVLVSERCGCASTLVHNGRNGFTFDPDSVDELADRMLWLHTNEGRLAQMGRESSTIIAQYSPHQFARQVESLYRELRSQAGGDASSFEP